MKVVILQRILPHYRVPLVKRLQHVLEQEGVELRVVFGQERSGSVPKTVELIEPWAIRINNKYINTPLGELVWQPCWKYVREADLLIVEQANRLLINYYLQGLWRGRGRRLAFWGHGANFQSGKSGVIKEYIKRRLIGGVDWWFAYTRLSAEILERASYPEQKTTVVQNSIDTTELSDDISSTTEEELVRIRKNLGLNGEHVGLYCGGLYAEKRIEFLLAACDLIRERVPDFELIVIGSGPESEVVRIASDKRSWMHYVGPKYGQDRAPYFLISQALLMPGMVGLVLIDSFVTGVPLFTTSITTHSPEITYLENGINGVKTANTLDDYTVAVVNAMVDDSYREKLKEGCARSAQKYTLDNMVREYSNGILRCLGR